MTRRLKALIVRIFGLDILSVDYAAGRLDDWADDVRAGAQGPDADALAAQADELRRAVWRKS